jgi:hypothetical protein
MSSLLERLAQHEAATRVRVEALRAEMAALAERLSAEEALLERLQITKTTVTEVLADEDPGVKAAADTEVRATFVAPAPAPGMQVPAFTTDQQAAGRLPVAYRDMIEVLADAGVPLRAMQLCQALGLGDQDRHREGMRSKLKRLARRGWLVEVSPGLFACASGVAATLNGTGGGGNPGGDRRS